ncbi:MAG: DUF1080 domain-containing protein, partial [Pirellula sp.]
VVLFDGKDFSHWKGAGAWKIEDGAMVAGRGSITSVDEFGDCQVHIEWSAATPPKGSGQGRSNSGVFLMNIYELQVLDSFDNKTYHDGQAVGESRRFTSGNDRTDVPHHVRASRRRTRGQSSEFTLAALYRQSNR